MRHLVKITALLVGLTASTSALGLTLATWNIEHLGWNNGKDLGQVAQVASRYDFLAVQEVMKEPAARDLERRLERVTGEAWGLLVSDRSVGRGRYREHYAFLWREAEVEYDGGAVIYLDPGDRFAREPFAARFRARDTGYTWTAASIHQIYGDSKAERRAEARQLDEYRDWLAANVARGDPILIFGDFNLEPDSPAFHGLRKAGMRAVVTEGGSTLSPYDGRYANLYDHIWMPDGLEYRSAGIDRFPERLGITHRAARDRVSDHAPVVLVIE